MGKLVLLNKFGLEGCRLGQADVKNSAGIHRPGHFFHEFGITFAHERRENMRVGVLELRWTHNVWMGIDPKHRQTITVASLR